jgi:trans-2,3-dihydro-3-hydroxyanthranilate isomerase
VETEKISMNKYRYRVVDVFTETPMQGNPLAVFPDAQGLDDAAMQRIAKELNLSETAFVLPATQPSCDKRVRIFTPKRELVFAGHPTIGSSFVMRDEGIVPKNSSRFVLEEKVGPVPIRVESTPSGHPLIWLSTPPIRFGGILDRAMCAEALGLSLDDLSDVPPQTVGAGALVLFVALRNRDAVDRAWADARSLMPAKQAARENAMNIFVFAPAPGGAYSRMFAPDSGIAEDPATGGATGPLAAYMMANKLAPAASSTRLISEQGVKMGRRSILHVLVNGENGADGIEVGGYVTPLVEAVMSWDPER